MFRWSDEARVHWFAGVEAGVECPEAEYFLVGLVLGLAIHNGVTLDLHLPNMLYRRLLSEPMAAPQLAEIAPDLWRGLEAMLAYDGDVAATFLADWSISVPALGGEATTVELVPGGAHIPVTNANRAEYVDAHARYLLETGIKPQFDAFQRGFLQLCDGPAFSLLRPCELQELVCGTPHLDFAALQANTQYDGFQPDDVTVTHFWEVVHGFSASEKSALLSFATGCDRAPVGGLSKLQFVLQRAGPDSMDLPHAHTCFNLLSMPAYASRGKLRDRLSIAIHNAQGFGLQ